MTFTIATPPATRSARLRTSGIIRAMRAELIKLTRPRMLALTALLVLAVAVGGTAITVLTVEDGAGTERGSGDLLTLRDLAEPGGGTAVFSQTAAFTYAFLLALFIASIAGEFTRGTFRAMLLQHPSRFQVLIGKLTSLLLFAAIAAAVAEAGTWLTARVLAPTQDIDTSRWVTADGLQAAADAYGRAMLFLVGSALLATLVGVLARSVPVGVAIGLVWSGPIKNIIGGSWSGAEAWFPGLLLRAVIAPDSTGTSTGRALLTLVAYGAAALAVIAVALSRRDVTE